jgi:two-component system sensor histidine kinase KdpD
LTELLLSYAPDIDIHIIPDKTVDTTYHPKKAKKKHHNLRVLKNTFTSLLILLFATLLSLLFHEIGFTRPNIIMVYILGVLLTSIATSHQVYSLISSIASVFVFNYLFTEPRFSLTAYETGYPVTFVVMFLTAYITGTFAIRYKEQARESTKIARRTKILFDTDQMLSKAHGRNEIIHVAAEQIMKLLGRSIVIFDNLSGRLSEPILFHTKTDKTYDWEKEQKAAEWALKNNHAAGATTELFPESHYLYLAIRVNERVYGVIGIDASAGELNASEHDVLLSILGETALALENNRNAREKEAAAILAESEQLRANLLRTISHDLRTPLTTISGNASNLLNNAEYFDQETKQQIYADIYNDSMWLTDLVENLLYATRIEDGCMMLQTSTELLSEMIKSDAAHRQESTARRTGNFKRMRSSVKADPKLIFKSSQIFR